MILQLRYQRSKTQRLSIIGAHFQTDLLEKYYYIFRIKISADPLCKVPQLIIPRSETQNHAISKV